MYKKLGILFWIVVLALFALCTRIAYLNVAKGDNYSIKVLEQQSFTSRNGQSTGRHDQPALHHSQCSL